MAINIKEIKLLWSNAAGRCSFPDCNTKLSVEAAGEGKSYTIGEMAHIKGHKKGSNRYDEEQSADERDSYDNLILLCPTHHTLIDKAENEDKYSVETLHEMKRKHESFISNQLSIREFKNVHQLKKEISVYLAENNQAWEQYGPRSQNARINPNSNQIYNLWISARLTIIVPNNRNIVKLLDKNRGLFNISEQKLVSKFIQHAKSYEQWINDQIPYLSIQEFPLDFESMIFSE